MRLYKVIYNAIEDVEAAMKGMLRSCLEEKVLGHAEVRQIFKASGVGNIAGSYVLTVCSREAAKFVFPRRRADLRGQSGILKAFQR